MTPIEYLYAYVRDIQKRHAEGSPRWSPWFVIVLILAPVAHALVRILLPNIGYWGERLGPGFLGAASPLYWASVLLAGIFGALFLDRRRVAIDARYAAIAAPLTIKAKVIAFLIVLGLGMGLTGLTFDAPIRCVLAFLLAYLLGFACIKSRTAKASSQET
jgi:hypothetical protein